MTSKQLDLVDPKAIEHLFDVAAALFGERGLDGVSIREISRVSNVSIASIYYHFKSKEALFAEVSLHKYEDFEREFLKRVDPQPAESVAPAKVALAFFDMLTADNSLLRLLQRDMIAGTSAHENFLSQHQYRHFRRTIDKMLGFDTSRPDDDMKSFSFAAVINGYSELVMADIDYMSEGKAEYLQKHRQFLERFVTMAFGKEKE